MTHTPIFLKNENVEQRRIAGTFLTLAGTMLWLFVLLTYSVWFVHPENVFGLYQVIPFWFWLGVVSMTLGMFIMMDSSPGYFFAFQFIMLNIMVWVTPSIIEPNARVTDPWNHYENISWILSGNHIPPGVTTYINWPGTFIFGSIFLEVSGAFYQDFLKFYPLISSTVFIIGYWILLNYLVDDPIHRKLAMMIHIPMNVWLQFHFSPQSVGLMLFPLIILAFYFKSSRIWQVTALVLIAGLTLSHPTTSIYLGGIVLAMFLWELFKNHYQNKNTDDDAPDPTRHKPQDYGKARGTTNKWLRLKTDPFTAVILLIVVIGTPLILLKLNVFSGGGSFIMDSILGLPETVRIILIRRFRSPVSTYRLFAFGAIALASFIYIFRRRKDRDLKPIYVGWSAGIGLAFITAVAYPGSHFHNRGLFFFTMLFVPLSIVFILKSDLIPRIFRTKSPRIRQMLVAVLIILSLVNMASMFNVENEAIISDSNLASSEFILNVSGNKTIYAEQGATVMTGLAPHRQIRSLIARGGPGEDSILVFDDYALASNIVGIRANHLYEIYSVNNYTNRVYDNGVFEVYTYNITA